MQPGSELIGRREFTVATLSMTVGGCALPASQGDAQMFGLIGKMTATPGQREALIAILLEGTQAMPGCLSYIVARDAKEADAIWITEVWDSKDSHGASLTLPSVKAAIAKARPLIAGFGSGTTTEPVGGVGLPK